jgi:histone arginine demethylase JMJD6
MSLNKMSFAKDSLSSERFHGPMDDYTRRKVRRIKRRHRTYCDPEDWGRFNTHTSYFCSSMISTVPGIDVVHCDNLSVKEFISQYESVNKPVIIEGITAKWKARRRWTFEVRFIQRLYHDFRNIKLRCGEDDHGKSLKLKLKYFLEYMCKQKDDSPLYVFDDKFGDKVESDLLLEDYKVPQYFREDLFKIVNEI